MKKKINIFKTFEEQELYFLSYYYNLTPLERLGHLWKMQARVRSWNQATKKVITIYKDQKDGDY